MIDTPQGNIAILCSGGDVSGMNPAIKHFVEYTLQKGMQPYFIYDGYEGLIDGKVMKATYGDVHGIIPYGGTKIRSARSKRFMQEKYRNIAKENLDKHGMVLISWLYLVEMGAFEGLISFIKSMV